MRLSNRHEEGLQRILELDRRIRFCAIVDEKGKVVASRSRRGLKSLNPGTTDKRLFFQVGLGVLVDRTWDRFFGKTSAIAIAKEKVNILIFSTVGSKAYIVATEPDFPISRIEEIAALIDKARLGNPE